MDSIMKFMETHWQLSLIGIGIVVILGAVFNVQFILDRQGGSHSLAYLSDTAYRVIFGIIGIILISYGTISLF